MSQRLSRVNEFQQMEASKINMNIDHVRLANEQKVALRAVKEANPIECGQGDGSGRRRGITTWK